MNGVFQFVLQHGYSILFAAVFARQIGLPVPANLFVLAAGALAAAGRLAVVPAILLAIVACVIADWCWYEAGRFRGDKILHFLHQFASDPAVADRRAKKNFTRFGSPVLVVAKFIPGLDLVAPPMAGTSGTSRPYFLVLETIGAALWASANAIIGYVFSHDLNRAAIYVGKAGTAAALLAMLSLCSYGAFRMHRRHRRNGTPSKGCYVSTDLNSVAAYSNNSCPLVQGANDAD